GLLLERPPDGDPGVVDQGVDGPVLERQLADLGGRARRGDVELLHVDGDIPRLGRLGQLTATGEVAHGRDDPVTGRGALDRGRKADTARRAGDQDELAQGPQSTTVEPATR